MTDGTSSPGTVSGAGPTTGPGTTGGMVTTGDVTSTSTGELGPPTTGTSGAPGTTGPGCPMEQALHVDGDGDGFGDPGQPVVGCPGPGLAPGAGDCDDADAAVHPGQPELCNVVDDDCDGYVDEFDPATNIACGACTYLLASGRLYGLCSGARTWTEARVDCQQRGLDLAIEIDWAEHDLLVAYLPIDGGQWFIGGHDGDNNQEGNWKWVDGAPVPLNDGRWGPGQPDGKGSDGKGADCLGLVASGMGPNQQRWVDETCAVPHRWICEGDPP